MSSLAVFESIYEKQRILKEIIKCLEDKDADNLGRNSTKNDLFTLVENLTPIYIEGHRRIQRCSSSEYFEENSYPHHIENMADSVP
jgi:hypothetical protein